MKCVIVWALNYSCYLVTIKDGLIRIFWITFNELLLFEALFYFTLVHCKMYETIARPSSTQTIVNNFLMFHIVSCPDAEANNIDLLYFNVRPISFHALHIYLSFITLQLIRIPRERMLKQKATKMIKCAKVNYIHTANCFKLDNLS